LYPGGRNNSIAGWVAIYLANRSNKSITVNFDFSIKDGKGKQVVNMQTPTHVTFGPMGDLTGFRNFTQRSTIIDSLVDGTLVVEVHIKPHEPTKARHRLGQRHLSPLYLHHLSQRCLNPLSIHLITDNKTNYDCISSDCRCTTHKHTHISADHSSNMVR
jgi:hypothetical protein